jgi:hypothetical protein
MIIDETGGYTIFPTQLPSGSVDGITSEGNLLALAVDAEAEADQKEDNSPPSSSSSSDHEDLESHTAFSGILIHSTPSLESMVKRAKDAGFRLEVHCIGDMAAEQV